MTLKNYDEKFKPLKSLQTKYITYIIVISIAFFISLSSFLLIIKLSDSTFTNNNFNIGIFWISIVDAIFFIFGIIFSYFYFYTIEYEILPNEIHVFKGLITKTRKIVPMRTITNIDVKRGIFDRFFRIGTIEVQTAGYSGNKTGPEERIDGITQNDLQFLQDKIINQVRKITGTPGTSHDLDLKSPDQVLNSILMEIVELKELLEKKLN